MNIWVLCWKWLNANCAYPDECVPTDCSSVQGGANSQSCQWPLNVQLHFFLFVVAFLKGKGRIALQFGQFSLGNENKSCHPDLIREEGFGTEYIWKANPPSPVTCFFRDAFLGRWWQQTSQNPPARLAPQTLHTSSLEDRSTFCLETDEKHKRVRHVSVKSAVFASSPVPSIFSYLPARAIRCHASRGVGIPQVKFSRLVVNFFKRKEFQQSVHVTKVSGW